MPLPAETPAPSPCAAPAAACRRPGALLTATAGAVLILTSWSLESALPPGDILQPLGFPLRQLGWALVPLALLPLRGIRPKAFAQLSLLILVCWATIAGAEVLFRTRNWDFRHQEAAWRRLPPFTREPRVPTGSVFFRRDGPEAWTGAVIRTSLQLRGRSVPPVYAEEPEIVVRYDQWGFRDQPDLNDWDLAVAGDSFTELGCLPHERLFTTLLSQATGLRVRNLGVSGTGPYTHLHYLNAYGLAPSLRQAGIVFFEGNDLDDLLAEREALARFETIGERPSRAFIPQSSLLGAAAEAWDRWVLQRVPPAEMPFVHTFLAADGPIPVHLTEVPRPRRLLPGNATVEWDRFCKEFSDFGRSRSLALWLAYMPCKARVLHPGLRTLPPPPPGREPWWPPELPGLVEAACRRHAIRFLDLSPALLEASRDRRELVYNPLWEFHLNARGSECVARELARQLTVRDTPASPIP